jgi:hypothetical protein
VRDLAEGFGAIAVEKWPEATNHLANVFWDHARIGGSLAQRDLIEFAMLATLLKLGRQNETHLLISTRRPLSSTANAVKGPSTPVDNISEVLVTTCTCLN